MNEALQPVSFSLEGRTAIVTGSGKNIGRAIALEMARFGARVVVNGHRDEAALAETVTQIETLGGQAIPVLADIADPAAAQRLVAADVRRMARSTSWSATPRSGRSSLSCRSRTTTGIASSTPT